MSVGSPVSVNFVFLFTYFMHNMDSPDAKAALAKKLAAECEGFLSLPLSKLEA